MVLTGELAGQVAGMDASSDAVAVTMPSGEVQLFDRKSAKSRGIWKGFQKPSDVAILGPDRLAVAERDTGRIYLLQGDKREALAGTVAGPVSLRAIGTDELLITATDAGTVMRYDLRTRQTTQVASGLDRPRDAALVKTGELLVLEAGKGVLTLVDVPAGTRKTIATGLAVTSNRESSGGGIAVGRDAIYVATDKDSSIYRLRSIKD
jgi:glucose/arabinose dehydrogenase